MKAYVGIAEGEILGVGGVAYSSGIPFMFFDISEEVRKDYPITLHKMAKRVMREVEASGPNMLFAEQSETPVSRRWLASLGFSPVNEKETRMMWQR